MGFPSPANDHFKKRGVINMECCIHQPTSSTFSPEQEQAALSHLKPTLDVVVKLCSEVKIQIKKILISCSELLELARSIPSIAETNKTIDMSSALCQPVMYLALLTEGYYAGAVKETDIEYHCRLISRYNK
jgi:hypothetical protein